MSARKPYHQPQPANWWLQNRFFIGYMVREATSVCVALYCVLLLLGLYRLAQGEEAWNGWLEAISNPLAVVFHCLVLAAVLYHAVTWFRLAPRIMVVRLGDRVLPEKVMLVAQWCGLVVVSALLLAVFLGVFAGQFPAPGS